MKKCPNLYLHEIRNFVYVRFFHLFIYLYFFAGGFFVCVLLKLLFSRVYSHEYNHVVRDMADSNFLLAVLVRSICH